MLASVLHTVIIYAVVIFAMRLMGKRQLGELQPSELVTTFMISNVASICIDEAGSAAAFQPGAVLLLRRWKY